MLQKRTVSFDIVYDTKFTSDPINWDFYELLDMWHEHLTNLVIIPVPVTDEDVSVMTEKCLDD